MRKRLYSDVLSWPMLAVFGFCFALGAYSLIRGISLLQDPAECSGQAMAAVDLCYHYGRGSEELIVNGATMFGASGKSLSEQSSLNTWFVGPLYVLCGGVFLAVSSYLLFFQMVALVDRWRDRAADSDVNQ
ncbi:hypothetical protein GKZ92_22795 (plasmid) [Gordonia sp. 135]|uniref:hypothetical protein n=1 Tax=Gordonia sp. 135 TaxID=2676309 RepID=UPI0012BB2B6D|nr:hypothetical protein [Gordonia sp. 135]QGP90553.1 hypothetical protein GKZ92_22795 [Gordonia sp. 135]